MNNPQTLEWQLLTDNDRPYHLSPEDKCYFLGYRYSWHPELDDELSNILSNFKKGIDRKSKPEWRHRNRAVEVLADKLNQLLPTIMDGFSNYALMAMPSSKKITHEHYDYRFEKLFDKLAQTANNKVLPYGIKHPISLKEDSLAVHAGGERDPTVYINNYSWKDGELTDVEHLIVCDDILTSGSHFRAVIDFLRQNGYKGEITCVCFGRHVHDLRGDFKVLDPEKDIPL